VVDIRSSQQLAIARNLVRALAQRLGFPLVDTTKFVTAASELGRNVLVHGGGGTMSIAQVERDGRCGVRLVFADQGKGIADIAQALTDGFSTTRSMGVGLGGARRLVNEFELTSAPGAGTTVTVTRWKRR
jgi:serine/threonine-protein kinase RsbT